jgi:hypothetical protein
MVNRLNDPGEGEKMKIQLAVALLVCSLALSLPADAGSNADFQAAQQRYLQTAKEYLAKSRELAGKTDGLNSTQKDYVRKLSSVYSQLANTKVDLADAIGARDWSKEEKLEKRYYRLKDTEKSLWNALEASKK